MSGGETSEGYRKAVELMKSCATEHGFLASNKDVDNYHRIWGRDASIIGLAALLTEDDELVATARRSLTTLASYQGPHGEIPSNVDPRTERVSYGGTAGRVDADLWWLICCGEYFRRTEDESFLDEMMGAIEKVRFLLGAWEFNNRGLIYVPPTGDWADEYVHSGYVLYDNLLYWAAQRAVAAVHRAFHGSRDHDLDARTARLAHLIRANYWFGEDGDVPDDVYHEVLYEKGLDAAPRCRGRYWMSFFSPLGYGFRFDAMANVLVALLEIADESQNAAVDRYLEEEVADEKTGLLRAFHPVIKPKDEAWEDLQMTFSYTFKNQPHEYHNGGLWPLVTGFYAASLAARGHVDAARERARAVHDANARGADGGEWTFPEFLHGRTHEPGGVRSMGWSAAAGVIADAYGRGARLFGGAE